MDGGSHLRTPIAALDLAILCALYLQEARGKSTILYVGVEVVSCVIWRRSSYLCCLCNAGDVMGSVLQPSCQAMFVQVKIHQIGATTCVLLGQGSYWGFSG